MKMRAGDLVTRGDGDVHRVLDINDAGDMIDVECVTPPLPWTAAGERESNMANRYEFVGALVDLHPSQWSVR